jgi:hypothetical protein
MQSPDLVDHAKSSGQPLREVKYSSIDHTVSLKENTSMVNTNFKASRRVRPKSSTGGGFKMLSSSMVMK